MTPQDKAKLVKALRSGVFPQGKLYLCREGKYCCMGVAKVVLLPEATRGRIYASDASLTTEEMAQIGITHAQHDYYVGMNDGGATFLDIADDIENNAEL